MILTEDYYDKGNLQIAKGTKVEHMSQITEELTEIVTVDGIKRIVRTKHLKED